MTRAAGWCFYSVLLVSAVAAGTTGAHRRAVAGEVPYKEESDKREPFAPDEEGSVLVTVGGEATQGHGALYRVSRQGRRTLVSDFGDPTEGPLGVRPFGVQIEAGGTVLVVDTAAGTDGKSVIFRVNPRNGGRRILSDFGDPNQGRTGNFPENLALDSHGEIFISSSEHAPEPALVWKVDPFTGHRTVISDFSDPRLGPLGVALERVAPEPWDEDRLLVIDRDFGPNKNGALFEVNRFNGRRKIVSDFGDATQGRLAVDPEAFLFEPDHRIVIQDEAEDQSQLIRVDVSTGLRTVVSDFTNPAQGPGIDEPEGIARQADGVILVAGVEGGPNDSGALYRVNPVTGARSLFSDFGDVSQGPIAPGPAQLAVVPHHHHHDR